MEWQFWDAIIRIIVCLPIVGILAYLIIKYGLAKNYSKTKGYFKLIEQVAILPKATLNIVRVGDEYFFISATEQEVVVIKQLDDYQEYDTLEFRTYLNDTIKKFTRESTRHE